MKHLCCLYCSQPFSISKLTPNLKGRIPLVLTCGHSICQICLQNILKFAEPIICKDCSQYHTLSPTEIKQLVLDEHLLRTVFPINMFLFGVLTQKHSVEGVNQTPQALNRIRFTSTNKNTTQEPLLQSQSGLPCAECNLSAACTCNQCNTHLCHICFDRIHSAYNILKSHVKQPLALAAASKTITCDSHLEMFLEFFCTNCDKSVCHKCMYDESCSKNEHQVKPIVEKNAECLDDLKRIREEANDIYLRLKDTVEALSSMKEEAHGVDKCTLKIQEHFAKMHALLQLKEINLMNSLEELKQKEVTSWETAKTIANNNVTIARDTINTADFAMVPSNISKVNIPVLIKQLEDVKNTPWYISKDEQTKSGAAFHVDENIYVDIGKHIQLEEAAFTSYNLLATKDIKEGVEIPPQPIKPVFKSSVNQLHPTESKVTKKPKHSATIAVHAVSPTPRPLLEGSHEYMFITHINNPQDFFLQRVMHKTKLKEMMRDFAKAKTMTVPQLNQVVEDKIFLGYSEVEKQWNRCRILNVDRQDDTKPVFMVFYIDSGQTDHVTLDKLRILSTQRVQEPALALHARLANCQPLLGAWDQEDVLLMQQIINNKQVVTLVTKSLGATKFGLSLECDVTTADSEVNIVDALVFHERARYIHNRIQLDYLKKTLPRYFVNTDLKVGDNEDVIVTYVRTPDDFYVRKVRLQEQYCKLSEELNKTYNNRSESVYMPTVGMPVVCNVNNYKHAMDTEGGWRRALVLALHENRRVHVQLVDSGRDLVVHWSVLRRIHERFTHITILMAPPTKKTAPKILYHPQLWNTAITFSRPADFTLDAIDVDSDYDEMDFAIKCHLHGILPTSKKWSNAANVKFMTTCNKTLNINVEESTDRNKMSVAVILRNMDDTDTTVNADLAKHNLAIAKESKILGYFKKPQDKQPNHYSNRKTVTILKKDTNKKERHPDRFQPPATEDIAPSKHPFKLEVKILSCQSPACIYVSLVDQQDKLSKLFQEMQLYYSNKQLPSLSFVKIYDRCAVFSSKFKKWHRAVVEETNEENSIVKVFLKDLALCEEVDKSQLKSLPDNFLKVPEGTVKCHLSGVAPALGEQWPIITNNYLDELANEHERFYISKHGNIQNNSLPVRLWVYSTTVQDALEPNISQWININDKIVEQGLAVVVKSDSDDQTESTEEVQTFPIEQWFKQADTQEWDETEPWQSACELQDKKFIGIPTELNNKFVIFLHDIVNEQTMDEITAALDEQFQNSVSNPQEQHWSVGQPCIVKYDADNKYHRGTVLEVSDDSYKVLFVDYGTVKFCTQEEMRKKRKLAEICNIPIQAVQCQITSIKPMEGKWSELILEYLRVQIISKECLVSVIGEKNGDIYPVEIKIGNVDISDLLVSQQYAFYAHGPLNSSTDDCNESNACTDDIDSVDSKSDIEVEPINEDWSKQVEEEIAHESLSCPPTFLLYPTPALPSRTFSCTVTLFLNETDMVLHLISDEPQVINEFSNITVEMQEEGYQQPSLDFVYEHEACIALFSVDNHWYRAKIIQYNKDEGNFRVEYVDYGNQEVLSKEKVRKTKKSWCNLEPQALTASLYGVQRGSASIEDKLQRYTDFIDCPLQAKVVQAQAGRLEVQLFEEGSTRLLYQHLIDDGSLISIQ